MMKREESKGLDVHTAVREHTRVPEFVVGFVTQDLGGTQSAHQFGKLGAYAGVQKSYYGLGLGAGSRAELSATDAVS